jgi:hypothetical protein
VPLGVRTKRPPPRSLIADSFEARYVDVVDEIIGDQLVGELVAPVAPNLAIMRQRRLAGSRSDICPPVG